MKGLMREYEEDRGGSRKRIEEEVGRGSRRDYEGIEEGV